MDRKNFLKKALLGVLGTFGLSKIAKSGTPKKFDLDAYQMRHPNLGYFYGPEKNGLKERFGLSVEYKSIHGIPELLTPKRVIEIYKETRVLIYKGQAPQIFKHNK